MHDGYISEHFPNFFQNLSFYCTAMFNHIHFFYFFRDWPENIDVLPKLNLPMKSCEQARAPERRHLNIVQHVETSQQRKLPTYKNINELKSRIENLKIFQKGWIISNGPNMLRLTFSQKPYITPQFEIIVDESLGFSCAVYGLLLPEDHTLYKMYKRSLRNVTISQLQDDFMSQEICPGVNIKSDECLRHIIPCELEFDQNGDHLEQAKQYYRSKYCLLLTSSQGICSLCDSFTKRHAKYRLSKQHNINTPAHLNGPLSHTHIPIN